MLEHPRGMYSYGLLVIRRPTCIHGHMQLQQEMRDPTPCTCSHSIITFFALVDMSLQHDVMSTVDSDHAGNFEPITADLLTCLDKCTVLTSIERQ